MSLLLPCLIPMVVWAAATVLLLRAKRSSTWPRVEAVVVESRVKRQGNTSKPIVVYTYAVDGQHCSGHRIIVGPSFSISGDWAKRTVERFPQGARVSASVDPARPTYSVLTPGVHGLHIVAVVVSSVFAVALLFVCLIWLV